MRTLPTLLGGHRTRRAHDVDRLEEFWSNPKKRSGPRILLRLRLVMPDRLLDKNSIKTETSNYSEWALLTLSLV
jgi:hypothetical protein